MLLATELEGVLLPLPNDPRNRADLMWLVESRYQSPWQLVYLTQRTRAAVCEAIITHHLPLPDVVIADGGTTIYTAEVPFMLTPLADYETHLRGLVGEWEVEALDRLALNHSGMRLLDEEHQGRWQRCFHIAAERLAATLAALEKRLADEPLRCRARATPPAVGEEDARIDLLPASVDFLSAFEWWIANQTTEPPSAVYAGQASNATAISRNFRAILVAGNEVSSGTTVVEPPEADERFYHATAPASSGVVEGWRHFLGQARR